jgi:hypothetical protein
VRFAFIKLPKKPEAFTKLGAVRIFRDGIIANGTYELYRNGTLQVPADYPMLWNVNQE